MFSRGKSLKNKNKKTNRGLYLTVKMRPLPNKREITLVSVIQSQGS